MGATEGAAVAAVGMAVGLAITTTGTGTVIATPVADPTFETIEAKAAGEDTTVAMAVAEARADGLLTTTV